MTFKPFSRRCLECNKSVHIITEDQQEVTCECGAKYRVVIPKYRVKRVADYSIELISGSTKNNSHKKASPWEKFSR